MESIANYELSLRYRRANLINGYNSPYLIWNGRPTCNSLRLRMPSIMEILKLPITA